MWTFSSAAAEHLAYIGVPNSGDFAWTFWTFDWETPAAGEHTVTSRAIAVSGKTQPAPDNPYLAGKTTYWESNGQITRRVNIA